VADSLGPIPIPDPPTIGPFPIQSDYGGGLDHALPVAVHQFDQAGLKVEQRFVLGAGQRRFRIQRVRLACNEYDQLRAHWEQAYGVYAKFSMLYQTPDGQVDTYTCRYENPTISFDQMIGMLMGVSGLTLLEIPAQVPPFTSVARVERFPDATLAAALTSDLQHVVPLIKIQDRAQKTGPLYISNQRLVVDGNLYLPRLQSWEGIQQSLGESSDAAKFTLGNADGVWTQLANQVNLYRASISFSLLHMESGYICDLWAGYALPYAINPDGTFDLGASDGTFQLGLGYPTRLVTRTCWKVYKGRYCPSTSNFPDCPKDVDSCTARGVPQSFGGMIVPAQSITVKDSTTGVLGWGRSTMTSVTVSDDTIYQRPVQEVYTDQAMQVTADVAAGRDENDYFAAIGIVSDGPIGSYNPQLILQRLDEFPPHDPYQGGGWRGVLGNDPAGLMDFFGIDQAPWNVPPAGSDYSAGLAFAEIRRSDALGLQVAPITDRSMSVNVTQGVGGWVWTAPGARAWQPGLANCVWVAINVYLRCIGLRLDPSRSPAVSPAEMEKYFDVNAAIAAAAICDTSVPKIIGTGNERQFPFRGILKERKPLKNWLTEILNCCLGYYTFVNGKLWIGLRNDSSALSAFTRDSILHKSLQTPPLAPQFNWLTVQFGDEEFNYDLNNVTAYDIDAASFSGTPESPNYIPFTMSLVGVSNKSQAARIATTRLREELGGIVLRDAGGNVTDDQQLRARGLNFATTILALSTKVGDVISLTHDSLAGGYAEGRVTQWTLNPDFSINIQATPTTDEMYALDVGPKPADVTAVPPRPEVLPAIKGLAWMPNNVKPLAGDPLYPDPLERTFDVWQDYTIMRDGTWDPAIYVEGELPVNTFISTAQVRIAAAILAGGGNLAGGQTVYAAVTQRDANGKPALPSNLIALWIDPALSSQKVTLDLAPPATGSFSGWDVWAGNDRRLIGWQQSGTGSLPLSVDLLGPLHPMTQGMPEADARRVRIAAKQIWHSGVAGMLVTAAPGDGTTIGDSLATNQIQCNDFIGSTDTWVNRYVSALADFSDGDAPLWNFKITAFDQATGIITISPDPAGDPIGVGDVLVVRTWADSVTTDGTTVTDPLWNNSVARNQFQSPGLKPGEEPGRVLRILRGKGQGQFRLITANDATSITVSPGFAILPNKTSVLVVEAADWAYTSESSDVNVPAPGAMVQIRMRLDNLRDHVALVGAFLVDSQDRQTDEAVAVFREIYIFGQPPIVRVIGPDPKDPDGNTWQAFETDHTIRVDTSANDITMQLPPLYVYAGRTLTIWNDGAGVVTINAYPGETFWDGSTSMTLDTQGTSLKVTAA